MTVVDSPKEFIESIIEGYPRDPYFSKVLAALHHPVRPREYNRFGLSVDQLITYSDPSDDHLRICVPVDTADSKLRLNLLHDFHDSPMSGHLGMARTHNLLSSQFYWPGLSRDVKDYVRSCSVCQRNKTSQKTYGAHQPLNVPPQR